MDNLTHTFIGALIGETLARTSSPDEHGLPAPVRRDLFVTVAAIGSNLPDVDLLYAFLGGKINYLLHHRGHSHTIVGALLLSAAVLLAMEFWLRKRGWLPSTKDRLWLTAILLLAPLLHIGMDATNNYGVHPFWPFYDGWLYGDSVFIAEPLLWAACAPLAFLLKTRPARILVVLLLATGVGLSFFSGLVPIGVAVAFTSVVAVMLVLGYRAPARTALAAGIALWMGVTMLFVATSQAAGRRIDELAARQFPQARLLDRVLTPMPANPVCWEVLFVHSEDGAVTLRRALLSLVPSWIRADQCLSRSFDIGATAPLAAVPLADSDVLKWHGQIDTPRDQLVALSTANCEAAAAMRFIRAPWLASIGAQLVLGDLRYDRETALGFAEIELHETPKRCPSLVPPWLPPRADLLH